jgi:acetyl-CoA C-acetyltransferase
MREEIVIVSAARTAIGKFQGSLTPFRAPQIGAFAVQEAVKRAGISPDLVEEVIMGNVIQAGLGQNPARQAAIYGGIPPKAGALTINKVCGSSLKAVCLAAQAIVAGDYEVIVAGGFESMTNAPYVCPTLRAGARLGNTQLVDAMVNDGLWDIYNNFHMGNTGELVAEKYGITRQMQDEFAYHSHQKSVMAIKEGKFKAEIVPVTIKQSKGPDVVFDKDEGPREDAAVDKLGKLKPAFKPEGGTVTAGNASQISDGGSAVVVMSRKKADSLGVKPLCKITGYAVGGLPPEWVMMAPVEAVKNLFARTGAKVEDFDLYEFNEPFCVASLALAKELKLDSRKLNVNGGATALGHPIGATGARILITLMHALKDRKQKKGLASLCLGGGNAVAMSIEMM